MKLRFNKYIKVTEPIILGQYLGAQHKQFLTVSLIFSLDVSEAVHNERVRVTVLYF